MLALRVEPRDQTREVAGPSYHVFFWDGPTSVDEWELTEADLDEVLGWIGEHSARRPHSLWATIRTGNDVINVRLRGIAHRTRIRSAPDRTRRHCS